MTIDPQFRDLMSQTVTVRRLIGRNINGESVFDVANQTEYSAHIVNKRRMVRRPNGDEAVAQSIIRTFGPATITEEDQIVLPDGRTPPILVVRQSRDEQGAHHTEIMV